MGIANTVISQENASLSSMATDQLLDLFSLDDRSRKSDAKSSDVVKPGMKGMLESLTELWDEKQYEEFNLTSFIQSLSK